MFVRLHVLHVRMYICQQRRHAELWTFRDKLKQVRARSSLKRVKQWQMQKGQKRQRIVQVNIYDNSAFAYKSHSAHGDRSRRSSGVTVVSPPPSLYFLILHQLCV